jgi:phosphotriesterase-related protein
MEVMTVSGPLPVAEMGVTDAHDHLFLRSPALAGQEIDDPELVTREVADARGGGLATIVELTPIGLGRRPDLMRHVATATGVNVIAATGYHRDAHYPAGHWVLDASEETLADQMTADIELGMDPADWSDPALPPDAARAGVIKVGASFEQITTAERRRFAAAAAVALRTGVAVVAHTEAATSTAEIADAFASEAVPPDRLVLAHVDRVLDPALHIDLLRRGLYLVHDTPGRAKYASDESRVELIAAIVEAGYGGQLLLGLDLGRRAYFRAYGGRPGLRHLMGSFVPLLAARLGRDSVQQMLVDNAAAAFAIRAGSQA